MKNQWLSLLLLVGGTLTCVFSSLSIRGVFISPQARLGLASYLPFWFWFGFISLFIGAFLVSRTQNRAYHLLALFLITFVIYLTPIFVEILPRRADVYASWNFVSWISENGHLNFVDPELYYHQFPGVFLFADIYTKMTVLDTISFLQFFSFLVSGLWVLSFYAFADVLLNSHKLSYFATILSIAVNVFMFQNHFSPSALGAVFFPLLMFLVMMIMKTQNNHHWGILYGIVFAFFVFLHPIFPLLFISVIAILFLYKKIIKEKNVIGPYLLFSIVLVFVYDILIGTIAVQGLINLFAGFLSSSSALTNLLNTYGGAFEYVPFEVTIIRRTIFILLVLFGTYFVVRNFLVNRFKEMDMAILGFSFITFLGVVVGLTPLGYELSVRVLFLVIPFAGLVVLRKGLNKPILVILIISMLVFAPLNFAIYYYDESEHVMYPSKYDGLTFLEKSVESDDFVWMDAGGVVNFFVEDQKNLTFATHFYTLYKDDAIWNSDVICYHVSSYARYFFLEGEENNSFNASLGLAERNPLFNKIYDTWAVKIFKSSSD